VAVVMTDLKKPRIGVFDLENSAATGQFWGSTYDTNIIRVTVPSAVCSFAWKWLGEPGVEFRSDHHDGHEAMVLRARDLLDEADAVVSYNGARHDTPHILTEILLAGLTPPSPYVEIDLYRVIRRRFKFQQNKLQYVAEQLQIGSKIKHEGFDLWTKVAAGDPAAWERFRRYNIQDVRLTEKLYRQVLPWIPSSMHPNVSLYAGVDCCVTCGSTKLQRRGYAVKGLSSFPRFQCQACGKWMTAKNAVDRVNLRGAA
jgi:DNA polymerase elongation subunit (family B)